jgi:putative transposase
MTLFRNKYRIESTRKRGWDYSSPGYYFVTICTLGKEKSFGDIHDDVVQLSRAGIIADQQWKEIPGHYTTVSLDEFEVMPNHVHGIIILENPSKPAELRRAEDIPPLPPLPQRSPKALSLSAVVRSYKGGMTRSCSAKGINFSWQPGFHDHIVRGPKALAAIREYIRNNPVNWKFDSLFKKR